MQYNRVISGTEIDLKVLTEDYCKPYYLEWLQDKFVNQYLETRWSEQNLEKIADFVKSVNESTHSWIFAIIHENKHVGNIKIGPVHPIYKYADVSYFIGDKSCWGKGIATEAVKLILKFGFEELELNKIAAGTFEQNVASQKVLLKNNFKQEAIFKKMMFLNKGDDYCDIYRYGILKEEYVKLQK